MSYEDCKTIFAKRGVELQPQALYDDLVKHAMDKIGTAVADSCSLVKTKGEAIVIMSMVAMEVFACTMSFATLGIKDDDPAVVEVIDSFADICKEHAKGSRAARHELVAAVKTLRTATGA